MGYGIAYCSTCGRDMSSGEECRLHEDTGHCFACYPGGWRALIDAIMGETVVLDEDEED